MKQAMKPNPAIDEAYEKAGGRKVVQESLGVTKATLSDWKRVGYVPEARAGSLERLSGVSRRRLNPYFDWGPLKVKAESSETTNRQAARQPKRNQEKV
jgi:DNA-binding transcriptional regulator YdaS (Cro superfamily)